jgi:probable O-glycosylation ligase (exosortase A-associated)
VREAILAVVVAVLSVGGLLRPQIAIFSWVWFAIMRPDFFVFASRTNMYSTVIAAVVLLSGVRVLPRFQTWLRSPLCTGLTLLLFLTFLSNRFAIIHDTIAMSRFDGYWRMLLVILFIPLLVTSIDELKTFLLIIAFSVGVLGLKLGLFGILQGGVRFGVGLGGFMSDNNSLASAMVTLLPFCWYMGSLLKWWIWRAVMTVMIVCSVASIVMTYSRGGALGLATITLFILARSKQRLKMGLIIAAVCAFPLYLVGDSYIDRLSTMRTPTDEASARSRIAFAHAAIEMWKDYPLLGVGFGMRPEQMLLPKYVEEGENNGTLVLHNTYLQMLVDSGTFAFLTYITLLFGSILGLGVSIRRTRREQPGLEVYPIAIQTGLVGFSVTSTFLSELHVDFIYILIMSAAVWFQCRKELPMSIPAFDNVDGAGTDDSEYDSVVQSHTAFS